MRKLLEISYWVESHVGLGLVSASFSWGAACLILHHSWILHTTGTKPFGRIIKRILDYVHFGLSLVVDPTKTKTNKAWVTTGENVPL